MHSKCDFVLGDYIDELNNPSNINLIEVNVAKSSKYAKNVFKIVSSRSKNISDKLKKNFKAQVIVHYSFGNCNYPATIRQNGDLKDHIKLQDGKPIRSLNVKLKNGNILNAVGFKLLIPQTRNGLNEVLAALIFRNLGFLAPETFEVNTSVNGVNSIMLFQEKSAKELLERNLRREGPIYEGDETLYWENKEYERGALEPLSLSRLTNDSWFEKGNNSQTIVLNSISKLQNAYLVYAYNSVKNPYTIFPNLQMNDIFNNYNSVMLAMNAAHGLRPHNRKYYYNAINSSFEPIYYDGNTDLNLEMNFSGVGSALYKSFVPLNNIVTNKPTNELINLSLNLDKNDVLLNDFLNRTNNNDKALIFFERAIQQFKNNMRKYETYDQEFKSKNYIIENDLKNYDAWYQNFQKTQGVEQKIAINISKSDHKFIISWKDGETHIVSSQEISKLLSDNEFRNKRAVYFPLNRYENLNDDYKYEEIGSNLIKMSTGIKIDVNEDKKILKFTQTHSSDWVLISSGDLSYWKVEFYGLNHSLQSGDLNSQRFNNHGLTGCFSIYESIVNHSTFSVKGGGCEDSINFISSVGENITLDIENAMADAVDADFSNLSFKNINIMNAGNDCFDVSGGHYKINKANLDNCNDKALSVGEKSNLIANNVIVKNSNIAISAKDLSKVIILTLDAKNISLCAEVKRKKQEFGGARLKINNNKCNSKVDVDNESTFNSNKI
tara:strand:- start:4471 stop:6633 length:2163 start_codon:yes stop_codon:yes gene_type:complete